MNLEWVHYLVCLRAVLCREAQTESLVYHGNSGHEALCGFPHLLSVKVVADLDYRVNAVLARNEYAIDRKEAVRIIRRIDERRERWSGFLYKADPDDVSSFDMVIDLSRKSIPDAFELISAAVTLPQFQTTPESKKLIDDLTRAAQLRAKIAMETDIIDDELKVEMRNGTLKVSGVVHSLEDAEELKRFLSGQPDIEKVESSLQEERPGMDTA
jgi:hypothetical protein